MVSKAIASLSNEDLMYLEKILGQEFAQINERNSNFRKKNGWCPENSESKKLLRLLNAVRSQKNLLTMPKW